VGSFERSKFNRATQPPPVGSLFKPFVYTAAIDRGCPASVFSTNLSL
jgi:membrane carboxypeptidase/penicillin-binding protein